MGDARTELKRLKVEYQSIRDDYAIMKENIHDNVARKKETRAKMKELKKQIKAEKGKE